MKNRLLPPLVNIMTLLAWVGLLSTQHSSAQRIRVDPVTGLPVSGLATGNQVDPVTGIPLGGFPGLDQPGLLRLPKPPPPQKTSIGTFNQKNGTLVQGTVLSVSALGGIVVKTEGAKPIMRIPLYYCYPHEINRDSRRLNKFLESIRRIYPNYLSGFMFFHGYGEKKNVDKAIKCFETSANNEKYVPAAYFLQWIYQSNDGERMSLARAASWKNYAHRLRTNQNTQMASVRGGRDAATAVANAAANAASAAKLAANPRGKPFTIGGPNMVKGKRFKSVSELNDYFWGKPKHVIHNIMGSKPEPFSSFEAGLDGISSFSYDDLNITCEKERKIIDRITFRYNDKLNKVTYMIFKDDQGTKWVIKP